MSRVKSSHVFGSSISLKSGYTNYQTGVPYETTDTFDYASAQIGRVPEVKRNAKQADGYRTPSDYHMAFTSKYPALSNKESVGYLLRGRVSHLRNEPSSLGGKWFHMTGDFVSRLSTPPIPSYYTWALQQEARMKILNNIKDEAFDVAMLLAEIGKTATTASNLMLRIGRSMDAIRRRSPESFMFLMHGRMGVDKRRLTDKFLRETAGIFLEWKYGIMPSVYDLEGVTKSLDSIAEGSLFDRPPLMVARATAKRTDTMSCNMSYEQLFSRTSELSVVYDTSVSCRADFTVSGEALRDLSEYGIGLTSVATLLYDLTPFSFVANMVVPMAELIKAWGALAGVEVRGYTETLYTKYKVPKHTYSGNYQSWRNVKLITEAQNFTEFVRTGSSSIPMPLPFIRNPVKVGNIQTVLALFTQMRGRPPRQPKLHGFDNKDL